MNIGFVSLENPYSKNNNGGIGTYTGIMMKALSAKGHKVCFFTIGKEKDYRVRNTNIFVYFIYNMHTKYSNYFEVSYLIYRKVMDVHFKHGLDIIETPEWLAQGYVLAVERKIPLITRLHTPLFLLKKITPEQVYYKEEELIMKLEEQQCKRSSIVTTPSFSLGEILGKEWGINSIYIPNPIEIEEDEGYQELSDYILYMGRLEYRKGILDFAYAIKDFFKINQKTKVIICGRDTVYMKKSIKKQIIEICNDYLGRIIFIDHISGEEKRVVIKKAIAVVLPSIWENCSYVALESMRYGKTVIVSNSGGFIEMINDGVDGYKFEVNNVRKLSDLMFNISCRAIKDTGMEAKKKAMSVYDVKKVAKQYEEIIYKII